ncbi:uncharacterized protein LAESUDRAFT_759042 [Laetiporus sulphureus 93-53]|uniref:Uncharacterized protein n=1 Tax=Laetiporus sulphureus 93-53 TaxID=1314785 RepID=A0A165EEE9_9APHY|nr:uncharacterized protein LAESUDRAFT_759042 [Laetiporus sulphureus 93-53]KZT06872.1 hypothetical protein LAESUDRAFT_759042 [Laetiporus sulphureus 93-53]
MQHLCAQSLALSPPCIPASSVVPRAGSPILAAAPHSEPQCAPIDSAAVPAHHSLNISHQPCTSDCPHQRPTSRMVPSSPRSPHRKTFSAFLPSSWFANAPPPPHSPPPPKPAPRRSRTDPAVVGPEVGVSVSPSLASSVSSILYSPQPSSPFSTAGVPPPRIPKSIHIPRDKMKLARKVKKLSRIAIGDEPPSPGGRQLADMLEDPYSLTIMSPILLASSSPAASTTTFSETQSQKGSLKRSNTFNTRPAPPVPPLPPSASIHRAHSLAALQSKLVIPAAPPKARMSPISPVVFARPDEDGSQTSSAFYSDSNIPSKAPSIIREVDESPVTERPRSKATRRPSTAPAETGSSSRDPSSLSAPITEESLAPSTGKPTVKLIHNPSDAPPPLLLNAPPPRPSRTMSPLPTSLHLKATHSSSLPNRRTPSPLPRNLFDSDSGGGAVPKRSASLRAKVPRSKVARRRLSLDLRMLTPEPTRGAKLRKNKTTLVTKRALEELVKEEGEDAERGEADGFSRMGEPMSDKQRAMNLRRARKMMQLFGDKPPNELFQVTATATAHAEDSISIVTDSRRSSRATFASITSSTISLTVHRRVRDSFPSSRSASEPPSPLVFTGAEQLPDVKAEGEAEDRSRKSELEQGQELHDDAHPDTKTAGSEIDPAQATESRDEDPAQQAEPESKSDVVPPLTPSSPISPTTRTARAKPSIASLSLASTVSHTFTHRRSYSHQSQVPLMSRSHELESEPPHAARNVPPRTPPPFSNFAPIPPVGDVRWNTETEPPRSPVAPSEEFRARRLRAAKLSRFFGVAPHDLADALAATPATPAIPQLGKHNSAHGYDESMPEVPAQAYVQTAREEPTVAPERKASMTVEVAAEVPRGFRLGRQEKKAVQELDMADVLDQLRRMR